MKNKSLEAGNLYQKIGLAKNLLALDLMSRNAGDRILPISEYQDKFGVSRGTIQNAFACLKECNAVLLENHGHQGTCIKEIDYKKLQENCMRREILGIMPLPYSITYEGFATAMYIQFSPLNFNMAYARGAVGRIELVESGTYHFAICSQYAAEQSIKEGKQIEVPLNFGPGSFLSRHVLLLSDSRYDSLQDGMKIAYDSSSIDQSCITRNIIRGKKVTLVPIRSQQTVNALMDGIIDAGVWNYDDIQEHKHEQLNVVFLDDSDYNNLFSTAVMVIRKEDEYLKTLLKKYVSVPKVVDIIREVREKKREPYF
ncbi:GntR family transcriptional regulator YhfZ [Lacrimispora sp.]|uniref:GntR family transcriptional regulator YhfZ n=1 Tax=Lacrimispora sp. TaxID=2719234 RepID=UPI00289E0DFC|nr:GntR family transcriptional regulator YhfZ [Lacrimispora sp.]